MGLWRPSTGHESPPQAQYTPPRDGDGSLGPASQKLGRVWRLPKEKADNRLGGRPDNRQILAPLRVWQCLRRKSDKPFAVNYLRALKAFRRGSRYGIWPLKRDACRCGTCKGAPGGRFRRIGLWNGPTPLVQHTLRTAGSPPTFPANRRRPSKESVLSHGRTHP